MHKGRFLLILAGIALTHFAMAQNVGIGTNTPTQKLDIDGQIRIRGGAPGVGKVLTSAADGTASWATPSSGSNWTLLNGNVYRASGNVGIGTTNPAALFQVNGFGTGEGNVLFTGTFKNSNPGAPPATGAGTRMMWYPDKGAFRAGQVTGSQWDIGNIGNLSNSWGSNTTASGTHATAWGDATMASSLDATAWGFGTMASGTGATAWGRSSTASGTAATAWGDATMASSLDATAWGFGTMASGIDATAWGFGTMASGINATAWGDATMASGSRATAWGFATTAPSYAETVMGRYNTLYNPNRIDFWNSNDRLFVIGNGTSESDRSNALTILKNGRTGINLSNPSAQLQINAPTGEDGLRVLINNATRLLASSNGGLSIGTATAPPTNGLRVTGESSMQQKVNIGSTAVADATLHLRHTNVAAGTDPIHGLRIQNTGANLHFWTLYTVNSNGNLNLYSKTSGNAPVGNFNAGTGAYTATSNRHLKTNVQLIDADVLTRIQQLQPATYSYLRDPLQQRTVGFMAEDVQPIFPELVDTIGENGENLAINYAGFSVVAIKAIQLLQEKLDEKEKRIETLEAEMREIKNWMMGKQ